MKEPIRLPVRMRVGIRVAAVNAAYQGVKSAVHMRREGDRIFFDVALRNPTSKIAFFNRLQLTDAKRHPVRPSFYSDNYFTLLPGESKTVTIETAADMARESR